MAHYPYHVQADPPKAHRRLLVLDMTFLHMPLQLTMYVRRQVNLVTMIQRSRISGLFSWAYLNYPIQNLSGQSCFVGCNIHHGLHHHGVLKVTKGVNRAVGVRRVILFRKLQSLRPNFIKRWVILCVLHGLHLFMAFIYFTGVAFIFFISFTGVVSFTVCMAGLFLILLILLINLTLNLILFSFSFLSLFFSFLFYLQYIPLSSNTMISITTALWLVATHSTGAKPF